MRKFVVQDGYIVNVIEADEGFSIDGATLHDAEGIPGDIGWSFEDGTPVAPAPVPDSTDPVDHPLNPAQFDAILALMGVTVENIDTAIDAAISDPVQNAFAKAKVRKATAYRRENDLFALLGPIIGITDAQIDTAWMQAKDLH